MNKYNFDIENDRRNTRCVKWDEIPGMLPMTIADMDFEVCPEITNECIKRLENKSYGYNIVTDDWKEAYYKWWKENHNLTLDKEKLLFSLGVVASISSIVRRLTHPGENVVLLTPVYNTFFNSILNNGRKVLECHLKYENNSYEIDFEDLDRKLSNPQTTLLIFCNPHNPVGKIYSKEELTKVGNLCLKNNVTLISDEIHCDIVRPGLSYTPMFTLSQEIRNISIMLMSPTKTFNIAGIQTSAIYVENKVLYDQVYRAINNDEIAEPNTLALPAAIAGFTYGKQWVDEMNEYVYENKKLFIKYVKDNNLDLTVIKSDALYLLWVDISKVSSDSDDFCNFLEKNEKLLLCSGKKYGTNGNTFVRINLATTRKNVLDCLQRLEQGIEKYKRR